MFPTDVFRKLPALRPLITAVFGAITIAGGAARTMLNFHIAPVGTPKEDQTKCAYDRPISLIDAPSEALESPVLGRLMPTVGKTPGAEQFAVRSGRGVDLHVAELHTVYKVAQERRSLPSLQTLI